jgi:TolA-binding protein
MRGNIYFLGSVLLQWFSDSAVGGGTVCWYSFSGKNISVESNWMIVKHENAVGVVHDVLKALQTIDADTRQKKAQQITSLEQALNALDTRIEELQHQRSQVRNALAKIVGEPTPERKRRPRGTFDELREQVVHWMADQSGQAFSSKQLREEFPELKPLVSLVLFLKKPITEGMIKVDKSGGPANTTYRAMHS